MVLHTAKPHFRDEHEVFFYKIQKSKWQFWAHVLRQLRFVTLLKTTFLLSLTFFEAAQSGFPALLSSSTAAYQPVHISARKQQQNNNQWSKNVDER